MATEMSDCCGTCNYSDWIKLFFSKIFNKCISTFCICVTLGRLIKIVLLETIFVAPFAVVNSLVLDFGDEPVQVFV